MGLITLRHEAEGDTLPEPTRHWSPPTTMDRLLGSENGMGSAPHFDSSTVAAPRLPFPRPRGRFSAPWWRVTERTLIVERILTMERVPVPKGILMRQSPTALRGFLALQLRFR